VGLRDNDGFISGARILEELAKHGFVRQQVRTALLRLAAKLLIETPHSHYRELEVPETEPPEQFHFRATSSGVYHLRFWTGSFAFLDATSTDTPIFDEATRTEIAGLAASFDISDRLRRAISFRAYLEAQWHLANIGAGYYDFGGLLQTQSDSFASVREVVARGAGSHGRKLPVRR